RDLHVLGLHAGDLRHDADALGLFEHVHCRHPSRRGAVAGLPVEAGQGVAQQPVDPGPEVEELDGRISHQIATGQKHIRHLRDGSPALSGKGRARFRTASVAALARATLRMANAPFRTALPLTTALLRSYLSRPYDPHRDGRPAARRDSYPGQAVLR